MKRRFLHNNYGTELKLMVNRAVGVNSAQSSGF